MTITKRSIKGSALTYEEMDENIRDLYEDTDIDRVLINGNISSRDMSVGSIQSSGNINVDTGNINAISGNVSDVKGEMRTVPLLNVTSRTLEISDHGKVIGATSTITIPSNIFDEGQTITIYNRSSGNISISRATGVILYWSQTGADGNRTLATRGVATILCVDTNTFVITGGTLT